MRTFRPFLTAAGLMSLLLACGADQPTPEFKVKAAFIYNFAKFIEWPDGHFASDHAPFVIGVVGADPFNGALEQAVAGKWVGTHPVEVRHFDSDEKADSCEIVFITDKDDETESKVIARLSGKAVLTVGDSDDFDANGGAIRFFTQDSKIHFEINTDAADNAKLKISSKLLKLARIYKK